MERRSLFLEGAAVLALALAVRLVGIGQDAGGDELYHILAAKQYVADGTFRIHEASPYTRAEGFTLLIAWLFRVFGESPVVARIPSLAAGSLTVLVAFLWVRSLGERAGAWVAALLLAFDPDLMKLSHWARFYTLQHLLFLCGAISVYALLTGSRRPVRVLSLGAAAAASFWAALHLQVITRIGLVGVGLFAGAMVLPAVLVESARRRRGWLVSLAVVVAIAFTALLAWKLGFGVEGRRLATEVDLWAASDARNWKYYHWLLQGSYPTLWTLFPLLLLACAAYQPRLSLLCASIFGTAFVAHSLVAMKHPRYLSYVLPYFLIPCGIAVARLLPRAVSLAERIVLPGGRERSLPRVWAKTLVVLAVLFALLANPAFTRAARLLTLDPTLRQPGMEHEGLSWRRAAAQLRPLAAEREVVVSADDLTTLYYVGRLDYVVSATQLALEGTGAEFTLDQSTGAPLVSRPESIAHILRCHGSGLIVAREWALQTDWAVPRDTAAYIASHTTPVDLPGEWGIRAFVWRTDEAGRGADCPASGRIGRTGDLR